MQKDNKRISPRAIILLSILLGLVWLGLGNMLWAAEEKPPILLKDIQVHPLPGDEVQVEFLLSSEPPLPRIFYVDSGDSLILDFPNVRSELRKELMNQAVTVKPLKNIQVVEADKKLRAILKVNKKSPHEMRVTENKVLVNIKKPGQISNLNKNAAPIAADCPVTFHGQSNYEIQSFDFKRGDEGRGRLIFMLSTPKASIDFKQQGNQIQATFFGACIPEHLLRKYDVMDFGTPVRGFTLSRQKDAIVLNLEAEGDFEKTAYQMDNQFIIEITPITAEARAESQQGVYTGEKISLNFQDVETRAVLQIIADFAGFNLIASDAIQGNITLRLQNVPWDQALDIILRTKGLDQRKMGNVLLVGPTAEIAAREKMEMDAQRQAEALGQLRSVEIQINYAKAEDLAKLFKEKGNSLLSSRGNVSFDARTNVLLVQDILPKIAEIRALIKKLDIPVRQVEISAQIVIATNILEETLGMKFGGAANLGLGSRRLGIGRTAERARAIGDFTGGRVPPSNAIIPNGLLTLPASQIYTAGPTVQTSEGLFSDLAATATGAGAGVFGQLGLALARLPNGTLVDLEIQALEYENKVKTLARPKLMTVDQNKAYVEQGFEIPYSEATSSGAAAIQYKKAVLRLEVTPQITPDGKVTMDLFITSDDRGDTLANPAGLAGVTINTNRIQTKVLADNGETIVLGGVIKVTNTKTRAKVPLLGDIPFIGAMFRNKYCRQEQRELLIFITPRIVKTETEV